MPSKFYGIAAAGRPTIFIGAEHGEIGRILEENGCGFAVTPGDGEARASLEREALKRGLSNFRLRPYQPKERAPRRRR